MNTRLDVQEGWTLTLIPSPEAFETFSTEIAGQLNDLRNSRKVPFKIPASVPGCVHTDLISAGIIADIAVDGREEDQMWIGKSESRYLTTIKQAKDHRQKTLLFHGLDTLATIYINGHLALETRNMHRSYRLDVTKELHESDLELEIRFHAPLTDAIAQVEKLGLYPRPYEMPYNYQRKMACSYGWDWGPITISSGIWKKIELISWSTATFNNVAVVPTVHASIPRLTIRPLIEGVTAGVKIWVSVSNQERQIWAHEYDATTAEISFDLPEAQLWHPRGRGEQTLYQVDVALVEAGSILESIQKEVGFRTIELDTSAVASPDYPGKRMFAIKVNGQRLWIRGANWIPDDPFPTRITKERYERRIRDMLEVNINAIRVWGGGIYESEDFYGFCDREGIVVWQDFLFACAAYPETDEMFQEVELEAREATARLESHPSLVIWCGGNECLEGFQHWGWKEGLDGRQWGETFYRNTIPEVVEALDGTRPYIPGSPFSSHAEDVKDFNSGTNHIWDVWNDLGYERYEEYSPSFAAEFGFNGPGSWASLTKSIGKNYLDSRDPDLALHQKAFDGMRKIADGLKREFENPPMEGVEWYFGAALVQARAVEIGLKHFRSLYEICSGAFLWQFNDMWPAISWAVLDSSGFRKLAWHAMKSAYQPRTIAIGRVDQGSQLTILNDTEIQWRAEVDVFLIDDTGAIVQREKMNFDLSPYSVARSSLVALFPQIASQGYEGFLLADAGEVRTCRRTTLMPARRAPEHSLDFWTEFLAGKLVVEVKARTYLHELSCLPELIGLGTQVDSQMVSLLPGERHVFSISGELSTLIQAEVEIANLLWSHNRLINGYPAGFD